MAQQDWVDWWEEADEELRAKSRVLWVNWELLYLEG
jgi:hypothetical protein